MRLTCLRHGLTDGNAAGRYQGTSDDSLTAEQRTALARIAFDATCYDAIYCSPAGRCCETASCLGIRNWTKDTRIRERDFGVFEGLTAAQCKQRFPEAFAAFLRFDAGFRISGGESRADHLERIVDWLRAVSSHPHVLAVTHGGTIDFLYRMASGIDLHGGSTIFSASNASLSIFEVAWPSISLASYDQPLG